MLKTLIAAVVIALAASGAANAQTAPEVEVSAPSFVDSTLAVVKPVMSEAVFNARVKTCGAGQGLHNTAVVAEVKAAAFIALSKIAPEGIETTLKRNAFGEDAKAFIFKNTASILKLACTE